MFDINFKNMLLRLSAPRFRASVILGWYQCVAVVLGTINDSLVSSRNGIQYKLRFNAQVIYLEHFLNDKYDDVNRGIYIEDAANTDVVYFYNEIEEKHTDIYNTSETNPLYLVNGAEYGDDVDYIVKVPASVTYTNIDMGNEINSYNLAGKRYTIETI